MLGGGTQTEVSSKAAMGTAGLSPTLPTANLCSCETWEDLKLSKEHGERVVQAVLQQFLAQHLQGSQKGCFQLPVFWCYSPCAAASTVCACGEWPALLWGTGSFVAVPDPGVATAELCPSGTGARGENKPGEVGWNWASSPTAGKCPSCWQEGLGEMLWPPPSCASVLGQLLALSLQLSPWGFTRLLLGTGLKFLAERFWFPNQID